MPFALLPAFGRIASTRQELGEVADLYASALKVDKRSLDRGAFVATAASAPSDVEAPKAKAVGEQEQARRLKEQALYGEQTAAFRDFLHESYDEYNELHGLAKPFHILTFELQILFVSLFLGPLLLFDTSTKIALETLAASRGASSQSDKEKRQQQLQLRVLTFIEAMYESFPQIATTTAYAYRFRGQLLALSTSR